MNLREQTNPLAVARERPTRAVEYNAAGSVVRNFRAAADAAYDALKSGWSRKTAQIFMSSLATHAYPVIGDIPVNAITARILLTSSRQFGLQNQARPVKSESGSERS